MAKGKKISKKQRRKRKLILFIVEIIILIIVAGALYVYSKLNLINRKELDQSKAQVEQGARELSEKQITLTTLRNQLAQLKEQEEKLKAEKDKYGFNEKTTLKSAKVKGKKVTLKWNKVKGASGYEIYCKTGKGKWKLVKTLNKGSKASCKLKGKAGKKYTYKVRVFQKVENKVIYGQYSNTKSAKIKK